MGSNGKQKEEARWVQRLQADDEAERREAERELFDRFHEPVERVLRRLLGPDNEDCVQEALLDVFRGLSAFEGRSKLSTWVYRVTMRRGWKCLAERISRTQRAAPGDDATSEVHAEGATVEENLEAVDLARRFKLALDQLKLDQKSVMALSAVKGLTPTEIAEVLGIPVGTANSRLHRARQRMRELLDLPATA